MDKVAVMPIERRAELFGETASLQGVSLELVEKDFWVCWVLHRLFSSELTLPTALLFKGGTSLSKVFGVIERFSEDVDLSLSREALGFVNDKDPYQASSKKKARRLIEELTTACQVAIAEQLLPSLEQDFVSVLGSKEGNWSLRISEHDPQTVLFEYPHARRTPGATVPAYVLPVIRLEMGARSDHWPAEEGNVEPYAAKHFPKLFSHLHATVRTLAAERTFWEKVTLLHAEHHRPAEKPIGDRLSRHYYDVVCLYRSPIGERALVQTDLLKSVVRHKMLFFHSGWANYETAVPGTIRLLPCDNRISELKRDYEAMAEMIFGEVPAFEILLNELRELESIINAC